MNDSEQEKKFLSVVKKALDQSADDLDGNIQSRLRQARYRALEQAEGKKVWLPGWGLSTASVATAALVMLIAAFYFKGPQQEVPQVNVLDEIEIVGSEESLEFYDELDFYVWLAEEEKIAG